MGTAGQEHIETKVHPNRGEEAPCPGIAPPPARRKISPRPLSAPLRKRDNEKTPLPGKPGGDVFLFGVLFSSWGAVL
ncbi:hypothetical protein HMPREF0262_00173 [Clostridium sp. ATCC 29733]|nr:hypothetical protein HMPREF0262_00173 [Clostridium sp. ATCC 29733]